MKRNRHRSAIYEGLRGYTFGKMRISPRGANSGKSYAYDSKVQ